MSNKTTQYTKQFDLETSVHPENLGKLIDAHIAKDGDVQVKIKLLELGIDNIKLPRSAMLGGKSLSKLSETEMATKIIKTVLTIDKDIIDMGELASRIANSLTDKTSIQLLDLPNLALSLKVLSSHLVALLHAQELINITVFDASDTSDGWIMIKPVLMLPSKIRDKLLLSGDNMPPSLVPFNPITKNNESPWITNIPYNVFSGVQNIDNDIKAPLDFINRLQSTAVYVDQDLVSKHSMPMPFNVTKKFAKKNFAKTKARTLGYMKYIGENPMYLKHGLDAKLRVYCKSKFITYQGNDFFKSAIDLGEYEVSTRYQHGLAVKYCLIQIANCLDLDKDTFKVRIAKVQEMYIDDTIEQVAVEMYKEAKAKKDHKAPVLQLAKARRELEKLKLWTPTNPVTLRGMVALDATVSFMQNCSLLSGNTTDAYNSNLIDPDKRIDAYLNIFDEMEGDPDFKPAKRDISRTEKKQGVTQTIYGSSCAWEVFKGRNSTQSKKNRKVFNDSMEKVMPGTMKVIKHLKSLLKDDSKGYKWSLPDGSECRAIHTTMNTDNPTKVSKRLLEITKVVIDKKIVPVEVIAHRRITGGENIGLIALAVQSIDSLIVREMVERCQIQGFNILTIHDSFSCQYIHAELMNDIYRELLAELASLNILHRMSMDITRGKVGFTKSPSLSKYLNEVVGKDGYEGSVHHIC